MKPKITLLLLFILLGLNNVHSQVFTPSKPDLRLCGTAPNYYLDYYNCTSNNYTLNNVYLSINVDTNGDGIPDSLADQTCSMTPTPQVFNNVYVVLHYTSNSSSNIENARLMADLSNNGVVTEINYNLGTVSPGQGQRTISGPITWVCGTAISLERILVVWKTSGSATELVPYNCSTYNKSQCELPGSTTIATPLGVQFNYTVCNSGNQSTFNFNDFTSGGTPPYTYLWNFGDGTTSTLADPVHVYPYPYPGGPYTVTLTVTDSHLPNHLVSSQTQIITPPAPISITETITSANCSASNGSIQIIASGGTPPYSYSWSAGGSTTSNSGPLPPGSYTVTVTDSFGCIKSETFIIGPGDVSNPVVTAPNDLSIEGCGTAAMAGSSVLGNLGFSTSPVVITLAQLAAAGVTFVDASAITNITYQDVASGSCPTVVTRTFRLTDVCGNIGSDQQVITIQDSTPPSISAAGANATINCPAVPVFTPPTGSDSCGAVTINLISDVTTPGACAGTYVRTRTWDATDACGNHSAQVSQAITVQDNTPPTISAAGANATINCPAEPVFTPPTGSDACGAVTINLISDVTTPGACAGTYVRTRTWDATDACGNHSAQVSQAITVQDNTPPTISAAGANATINCPAEPVFTPPTGSDACGAVTINLISDVTTPGACAGTYVRTKTWDATDACGNHSAQVSQAITVQDNTPPTISAAGANATINCPAEPVFTPPTGSDACGAVTINLISDVTTPGACAGTYVRTRTWDATDACGNHSAQVSQAITVQDNTPPSISAAGANATINCPAEPVFTPPTGSDACGAVTINLISDVTTPGACAGTYVRTRTWDATDACGNHSAQVSQAITVQDNTPPTISAAGANATINCPAVPVFTPPTGSDACGAVTINLISDVTTPGACAGTYVRTRTWDATDACGNHSAQVSQAITVQDNTPPSISAAGANATINCPAEPVFTPPTGSDTCGAVTINLISDVTTPGACAGTYVRTKTWDATDACGNHSAQVSQAITVQDNTPPVPPTAPPTVTVSCSGDIPAMISLTANDACNGPITVLGTDALTGGSCSGSFTVTRTWRFVDSCGNSSSVSQTINVNDSSSPVLPSPPANITVSCISLVPPMISLTASDTCAGQITVQGVDSTVPGNCPNSFIITRTWTFADPCGNSDSVSQIINVIDNIPPVAPDAPADVTVSCGTLIPEMISLTANDACAGLITVQGVDSTVPGNCANSYVVTRTWTFVDACGNSSSVSQIINVIDNIPPVAPDAPADVTVSCSTLIPEMISLTANDACAGLITVQGVDSTVPGNCANSYVVTRTWTFVDACGNRSSVSQIINVNDNIPPIAPSAPADVTVSCGTLIPEMISLTANDACAGLITVQGVDSTVPGNCANSYVVTRTWTFVDACGNSSSVSQIITVSDTIPPVAPDAPADITVSCGTLIPPMISLTATDNCQNEITVQGIEFITLGACDNSYIVVRTWTFTDSCDNSSSVSQRITVSDEIDPVTPEAPADITVSCGIDIPRPVTLTANDNCSGQISALPVDTVQQGDCLNSYIVTRTWTFTDTCGNSSSISQIITVSDEIAPVAPQAPENITVECAGDVPAMISLTAYDNCQEEITVDGVDSIVQGDCANSFVVTRTWTFSDACGNISSVSQVITVSDEVAPTLPEAPSNITVSCSSEVPRPGVLIANDKCSGEIPALGVDVVVEGDCPNAFTVTRTWTFTDGCGNTSSISQIITVNDEIGPSWQSEDYTEETTVSCSAIPPVPEVIFTDNCSGEVTVVFSQIIENQVTDENNLIVSYDIIRTWTATDSCRNVTTLIQLIHVTINDTFDGGTKIICNEVPANANYDLNQFLTGLVSEDEYDGQWTIENVGFESALNGNILTVTQLPEGYYTLVYTLDVNDSECPRVYEFYVHIYNCRGQVLAACSIKIHNAVSPNNDGLNDIFYVQGLDCYPENSVQIYNRWGVLVFERNGYNNTSVVFEGKSTGRSTFNKGEELPDGTYFYILKYKDNETGAWSDKSGYLYLNR